MLGALWRALSFYPLNGLVLGQGHSEAGVGGTHRSPSQGTEAMPGVMNCFKTPGKYRDYLTNICVPDLNEDMSASQHLYRQH